MNIDLDKPKNANAPAWDLTVQHRGRQYSVRQPSAKELMGIPVLLKKHQADALSGMSAMFFEITGIEQCGDAELTLDQLSKFFVGLLSYIMQRSKETRMPDDRIPVVQAVYATKLN